MAQRGRRRGNRPRHRPQVARKPIGPPDSGADQPLIRELRQALRSDSPLDLLATVSGLLEVTDARSVDPFREDDRHTTRAELLESFLGTSYAETTAALTVMQALLPDELAAARIRRELATRPQPLPGWLRGIDRATVEPDVWLMTHVLGDGDDYFFGVTLPSGRSVSALVYVDHNLGTVVKDAFVVAEPLETLLGTVRSAMDDPDQDLAATDPATARAVIEDAINVGLHMYPPLTSDSWPMCRPLIEWMVRLLPADGRLPERAEWSDEDVEALAADFFASPFGAPLDHPDERGLLDSVLWFGTSYGTGDPLRWSGVTVELLLADWFPRKVVADAGYLAKLPTLLRAYIRYCHHRLGIRAALTSETLAAVDHWEPEYQRVIRTKRPQGAAALAEMVWAARNGALDDESDYFDDLDEFDADELKSMLLASLARAVGGDDALATLDDVPLPDEPFRWSGIPDDIHPVVQQTLDACDRCADELLDTEHRTAMRRFLARAAVADPAVFRRKADPVRGAAAVAWIICRANDTVGYHEKLKVKDLLAWFGMRSGSVSQRAEPLLAAIGVDRSSGPGSAMELGSPDLLVSTRRRTIIADRDRWSG